MQSAGYATRGLGKAVEGTGRLLTTGAHHGFLWNQMLFTMRRATFYATLGVASLGAGFVAAGIGFDSMMEQQNLAFKFFTGSVAGARKEVDFLFDLAAHGPFEFKQVIGASRQLMAFGFSVDYANKTLVALQDALAAMGLDQSSLDRATLALGQIMSSGRLLGQDLRQLEQLGLVNLQDLAMRLGVDPAKLASSAGSLGIPSQAAIDAIMAYWQTRYKGAAKDFQKTFVGQWSTLKDFANQMFGVMAMPLFEYLRDTVMPKATEIVQVMSAGFQQERGGGMKGALGALDTKFNTNTLAIWNAFSFLAKQMWTIFIQLESAILGAWYTLGIGTRLIYVVGGALWTIANVIKILNYDIPILGSLLKWLIVLFIADRTVVLAAMMATKAKIVWDAIEVAWTARKTFWINALTLARKREAIASIFAAGGIKKWAFATQEGFIRSKGMYGQVTKNTGAVARMARMFFTRGVASLAAMATSFSLAASAAWAFTIALLANPITWIVVGVIALVAGLVVLYFKWKAFHDLVNDTFGWIRNNWSWLRFVLINTFVGPIVLAIEVIRHLGDWFGKLKDVIQTVYDIAMRLWNLLKTPFEFKIKTPLGTGNPLNVAKWAVPGYGAYRGAKAAVNWVTGSAEGGPVLTSGWHMVGERGPELVRLPGGSHVFAHDDVQRMGTPGGASGLPEGAMIFDPGTVLRMAINLMLNDKVLAEVIAENTLDAIATA